MTSSSHIPGLFSRGTEGAPPAILGSDLQSTMASSAHLTHQRWLPKHHHGELPLGMTPYGTEAPYLPKLSLLEVLLCTGGRPLPSHRLRAAEPPAAREGRAEGEEEALKLLFRGER
jgi:hypothetical protein